MECCNPSIGQVHAEVKWKCLSTLSGFHERTIFSVDWSASGDIVTGGADNAIRIFLPPVASSSTRNSSGDAGASEQQGSSSIRSLFMNGTSNSSLAWRMVCSKEGAHSLDINCVRWNPTDVTLLATAGDDCTIKLWRYHPER
jgi:WD40 repeat protein